MFLLVYTYGAKEEQISLKQDHSWLHLPVVEHVNPRAVRAAEPKPNSTLHHWYCHIDTIFSTSDADTFRVGFMSSLMWVPASSIEQLQHNPKEGQVPGLTKKLVPAVLWLSCSAFFSIGAQSCAGTFPTLYRSPIIVKPWITSGANSFSRIAQL